MYYNLDQVAVVLSRPLANRFVEGLADALGAALRRLQGGWRRYQAYRAEMRAFNAIAHLNQHVLKDIGAPHGLIAQASARREAAHLRWTGFDFR